ncbi:MAG: hypothetical protein EBX50_19920, partial [Chitinophagia bacterium]|nr:hypothetical protein [Chitinophagia bacterium]
MKTKHRRKDNFNKTFKNIHQEIIKLQEGGADDTFNEGDRNKIIQEGGTDVFLTKCNPFMYFKDEGDYINFYIICNNSTGITVKTPQYLGSTNEIPLHKN